VSFRAWKTPILVSSWSFVVLSLVTGVGETGKSIIL